MNVPLLRSDLLSRQGQGFAAGETFDELREAVGLFTRALDVLENEPEMAAGLAELDNAVLTPHIASGSRGTRDKMAVMCAENAVALASKEKAPYCVNPEVYETDAYRKRIGRS